MRIIFLDIDGVLNRGLVKGNSEQDDIIETKEYGFMNKSLVDNLNLLTEATGAKIVLSSSWRYNELDKNQAMLKAFGISAEVIGQTPRLSGKSIVRGNEISHWIKENEKLIGVQYFDFEQYIIIDDDSDMLLDQAKHFIHTDAYAGLSDSAAYKAKNRLLSLVNTDRFNPHQ